MKRSDSQNILEASVIGLATKGNQVAVITGGTENFIGMRAFITGTIPGERIRARVLKQSKRFLELELVEVLGQDEHRVLVPCPVFDRCGGCSLQYMPIEKQRSLKVEMVESMLTRHGKVVPLNGVQSYRADILPSYSYRNRVTLHKGKHGRFGFRVKSSHEVVPISDCHIAEQSIRSVLGRLDRISKELRSGISSIRLESSADGSVALLATTEQGLSQPYIKKFSETCSRELGVGSATIQSKETLGHSSSDTDLSQLGHFSQVNTAGNEALRELVRQLVVPRPALELYAGAGNFSFLLAEQGCRVKAVELDPVLVELGTTKAKQLGATLEFICKSAEAHCLDAVSEPLLFLDPPRAGALEALSRLDLTKCLQIVYVSCDLASLCRDLSLLQEKGFTCHDVFVVDMFPQTTHVECVVNLKK
jgi:23S rRNA (uracil1939-C5)-methyltransferase